eukprot:CAMPEP_0174728910 /NCGR_PEP_ID=MMETSP1094-20130205/52642_1 /TAXON_ID=156173 /ORGANISM="Chrysochromulina brevifilum, Strain UTEX LB 985" /LENGTH=141 /DNA_ID=CAMNT_0015930921 /DNA_START=217 /DNA_END=643 /DNA_ORIENTATION=+
MPTGLLAAAGVNQREVSAVLYLSDPGDWTADDQPHGEDGGSSNLGSNLGGELVLYLGATPEDDLGGSAHTRLAVSPVGGRLVVFDAKVMLHEVMPHRSERPRIALTFGLVAGTRPSAGYAVGGSHILRRRLTLRRQEAVGP